MRYRGDDAVPRAGCGTEGRMRAGRGAGAAGGAAGLCGAVRGSARRGPRGGSRPFGMRRRGRRRAGALPGQPGPAASAGALAGLGGARASPGGTWEGGAAFPGRSGASPCGTWGCGGLSPKERCPAPAPLPPALRLPFGCRTRLSCCGAAGTRRNVMLSRFLNVTTGGNCSWNTCGSRGQPARLWGQ